MENNILFKEKQRFKQWWLWSVLLVIDISLLIATYRQLFLKESFGTNPISNFGLCVITALLLLFTLLFYYIRLDTLIKNDGIYIRFFPFQSRFKYFSWNDLVKSYVRHYAAIREYGGWGIRLGITGQQKALNISGNEGLQLEFTNGKKLLIGTCKADQISAVLLKTGHLTT